MLKPHEKRMFNKQVQIHGGRALDGAARDVGALPGHGLLPASQRLAEGVSSP